jgi:hypothetical protein
LKSFFSKDCIWQVVFKSVKVKVFSQGLHLICGIQKRQSRNLFSKMSFGI